MTDIRTHELCELLGIHLPGQTFSEREIVGFLHSAASRWPAKYSLDWMVRSAYTHRQNDAIYADYVQDIRQAIQWAGQGAKAWRRETHQLELFTL